MKKSVVLLLFVCSLLMTSVAMANTATPQAGGYTGPGPKLMTIKEAGKQDDNACVTVQGYLIDSKGDDKYTFKDASGTALVDIDKDVWVGVTAGAKDKVELVIEIDKEWGKTEFEAQSIKVIK